MKIKAVIFDFDGVLFDSVGIKMEAFRTLMAPYGTDVADRSVAYHLENGGISRYRKLRHFYEKYVGEQVSEEFVNKLAKEFSQLVMEGVIASPWMPGAVELLNQLNGATPLFICSGTPELELQKIVKQKKIDHYFDGVYGSPDEKPHILKRIMMNLNLVPEELVFIGDAMTDYRAASETSVNFVGFHPSVFSELNNVVVLNNLKKLLPLLENGIVKNEAC